MCTEATTIHSLFSFQEQEEAPLQGSQVSWAIVSSQCPWQGQEGIDWIVQLITHVQKHSEHLILGTNARGELLPSCPLYGCRRSILNPMSLGLVQEGFSEVLVDLDS